MTKDAITLFPIFLVIKKYIYLGFWLSRKDLHFPLMLTVCPPSPTHYNECPRNTLLLPVYLQHVAQRSGGKACYFQCRFAQKGSGQWFPSGCLRLLEIAVIGRAQGELAFRQGVQHSAYRQYLQLPILVSSWSISAVPYLLIFYRFSCLTCPSFPVINSCLTPVAVEHLQCFSAEGWVAAVSAGKAVSVCAPFGKH